MSAQTNERIHIAYSIWDLADPYNAIAGVALVSLLENTKSPCDIHLLYDENLHVNLPSYSYNKQAYHNIEMKYGCRIHFHHINAPKWLNDLPSVRYFSFGMFLRLFLPEILSSINRVIYLDCDICVTADIAELYQFNLEGKAVATDGIKFNSGVIVFDLDKIRQKYNLSKQTLEFLALHPRTDLPDQKALQHVFHGDCTQFDRKWNITTPHHSNYIGKKGIFHYSWTKPWKIYRGGEYSEILFWEYYSKTPWADLPQFVQVLATCSDLSLENARVSAERLLYYPLSYRLRYIMKFIKSIIQIHLREGKIKVFDFIRKHET